MNENLICILKDGEKVGDEPEQKISSMKLNASLDTGRGRDGRHGINSAQEPSNNTLWKGEGVMG